MTLLPKYVGTNGKLGWEMTLLGPVYGPSVVSL